VRFNARRISASPSTRGPAQLGDHARHGAALEHVVGFLAVARDGDLEALALQPLGERARVAARMLDDEHERPIAGRRAHQTAGRARAAQPFSRRSASMTRSMLGT
jgi:hypothetical protein